MNNWPLQSALCNKNSCQIIPFCLGGESALALASARRMQPKGHNEGIYGQRHTMTLSTQTSWGYYAEDKTGLILTPTISAACVLQLNEESKGIYGRTLNVGTWNRPSSLLADQPFVETCGQWCWGAVRHSVKMGTDSPMQHKMLVLVLIQDTVKSFSVDWPCEVLTRVMVTMVGCDL